MSGLSRLRSLVSKFSGRDSDRFSGPHFRELNKVLRFTEPEVLQLQADVTIPIYQGVGAKLGQTRPALRDAYFLVEEIQIAYEGYQNYAVVLQAYVANSPVLNPRGLVVLPHRGPIRFPVHFIVPPGEAIEFLGSGGSTFGNSRYNPSPAHFGHAIQKAVGAGYGEYADAQVLVNESPGVAVPTGSGWLSDLVLAPGAIGDFTLLCLLSVSGGAGYTLTTQVEWEVAPNTDNYTSPPASYEIPTNLSSHIEKTFLVRPPDPTRAAKLRVIRTGGTAPTLNNIKVIQLHAQHDIEQWEHASVLISVIGRKIPRDIYRDFGEQP